MSNARGIDVSVYNVDIGHLLPQVDFVIARASVGAGGDGRYARHSSAAIAAGKVLGAYHYAVFGPGPTRQAKTLLAAAPNAAFLAVDDEGLALAHPATVRRIIANLHELDRQHRHVGLYSSDGTWPGDLGQDFDWVANWSPEPPGRPWRFWQTAGLRLDHDQYAGTIAELVAWSRTRRVK